MWMLICFFFIVEVYNDISKKRFTTTAYIILTEIIEVIAFAMICYFYFRKCDKLSLEAIINRDHNVFIASTIFSGTIFVRGLFKSPRFEKNV